MRVDNICKLCNGGDNYQEAYSGTKGLRKILPIEMERLQGFPEGRTSGVSDYQRKKQLGNAVSVPVIKKLFHNLFK